MKFFLEYFFLDPFFLLFFSHLHPNDRAGDWCVDRNTFLHAALGVEEPAAEPIIAPADPGHVSSCFWNQEIIHSAVLFPSARRETHCGTSEPVEAPIVVGQKELEKEKKKLQFGYLLY